MKRKIFSLILVFMLLLPCALFVTACGKKGGYEPPRNVVQNLPAKIHVEYGSTTFVKDGNEYYVWAQNVHGSHRSEIYMKRELVNEYCVAEGYGGWHFITARYDDYDDQWILATNDGQNQPWNANDNNQTAYTNAEYMTRHGYSEVNSPLDSYTFTQLADQTIELENGQQVECVVWIAEFEYNGTYNKDKYWFAKDTGVYIKGLTVYDKTTDIDTDGSSYGHPVCTYYAVGENMADVLATKGRTIPDMSAFT